MTVADSILSDAECARQNPLAFGKALWPHVNFYDKQREITHSVRDNKETYVPAGNMLGKDFVAAFIVLWFFLTRRPCRIVTTSAKDDHLVVLWGEIHNFIETSALPLKHTDGGPLVVLQRDITRVAEPPDELSYVIGRVASQDKIAAMQGHHIPQTGDGVARTMFLPDECSSVPHAYYTMAKTWFNRMLGIGNTWPCNNFFKFSVKGQPGTDDKGGDLPAVHGTGLHRKVIQIKAEDSPNVRYAQAEIAAGKEPSGKIIVPGVKPYWEYLENRAYWDPHEQSVALDAEFYEGADIMLFPPEWLDAAEEAAKLIDGKQREAKGIGVDSAQGGDNSSWAAVDQQGLLGLRSKKTPDTSVIPGETIAFAADFGCKTPERWCFDMGGGGKQHADVLRKGGRKVSGVYFGESVVPEKRRGMTILETRKEEGEERLAYVNRRAQMYGDFHLLLKPDVVNDKLVGRFALPRRLLNQRRPDGKATLREQLVKIPKWYDEEGRLFLPKKQRRGDKPEPDEKKPTMAELIGCSPDEADALVLAVHAMLHKKLRPRASAG